jgi:hypothetical protein
LGGRLGRCLAHRRRVASEESALKTGIISVVLSILLGVTSGAVSAQPGAERFVLTGMVVWSGNEGVAWLQEPDLTRNEMVALRIGQSVGPWKLTRFLDNGIELEGPGGKVLIPLYNAGGGGTAVAAGAPAGPAAAPAPASQPADDASRVATQPAAGSPAPGSAGESNRPAPNASALTEAFNRARAARAQRQAENAPDQPREAAPAGGSQAAGRGPGTSSSAKSSGGVTGGSAGGGSNSNVIQFPVGGGNKGFRELFGSK